MRDLIFLHTNFIPKMFFSYADFQHSRKHNCSDIYWHTLFQEYFWSRSKNSQHVVLNPILKHSCSFFKHYLIFTINQFISIFRGITEELHFVLDKRTSLKVSLASIEVYTKLKKASISERFKTFPSNCLYAKMSFRWYIRSVGLNFQCFTDNIQA